MKEFVSSSSAVLLCGYRGNAAQSKSWRLDVKNRSPSSVCFSTMTGRRPSLTSGPADRDWLRGCWGCRAETLLYHFFFLFFLVGGTDWLCPRLRLPLDFIPALVFAICLVGLIFLVLMVSSFSCSCRLFLSPSLRIWHFHLELKLPEFVKVVATALAPPVHKCIFYYYFFFCNVFSVSPCSSLLRKKKLIRQIRNSCRDFQHFRFPSLSCQHTWF